MLRYAAARLRFLLLCWRADSETERRRSRQMDRETATNRVNRETEADREMERDRVRQRGRERQRSRGRKKDGRLLSHSMQGVGVGMRTERGRVHRTISRPPEPSRSLWRRHARGPRGRGRLLPAAPRAAALNSYHGWTNAFAVTVVLGRIAYRFWRRLRGSRRRVCRRRCSRTRARITQAVR